MLIDALYRSDGHPFSQVPQSLKEKLLEGKKPLGDISYLMFTHRHPDHFNPEDINHYVSNSSVKGVWLPRSLHDDETIDISSFTEVHALAGGIGEIETFSPAPELKVIAFNAGHMGEQYRGEDNYCFLLQLAERRIMITGDSDFCEDIYSRAVGDKRVEIVFVNPMFNQNRVGQRIIRDLLRPENLFIYHIPFPEDDTLKLRNLVEHQLDRKSSHYAVHALNEPMQSYKV